MAQVNNECPICIETFTGTTRKEITCPFCNYKTCLKCMKQHILNQQNPNCMNCHIEFNREFIDLNMTKNFRTKELKQHRENVLLEREKSLLPATIVYAEQEIEKRKMEKDCQALEDKIKELQNEIEVIKTSITRRRTLYYGVINNTRTNGMIASTSQERRAFVKPCVVSGCRGFLSTQYKCGICDVWVCPDCHEIKKEQKDEDHKCNPDTVETIKMIKKETKPCPKCGVVISKIDGCFAKDTPILLWNGTTKMSQDICVGDVLVGDDGTPRSVLATTTGEDMLYEITQNKGDNYVVNSKHTLVLKTEQNETIEIIVDDYIKLSDYDKKRMKGIKLFKYEIEELTSISVKRIGNGKYFGWSVDGNKRFLLPDMTVVRNCSQMWCVECHTTFDWNTGRETVTTNIHNPHYYEWVRRNNNGVVPRNPLDVNPCADGRLPYVGSITSKYCDDKTTRRIINLLRVLNHMRDYDIVRVYANGVEAENRDLRVLYLMNEVSEDVWKRKLQQREKKKDFQLAKSQVCEMITTVAGQYMNEMANTRLHITRVLQIEKDLQKIVEYYNESMKNVLDRFNSKARGLYIDIQNWGFAA